MRDAHATSRSIGFCGYGSTNPCERESNSADDETRRCRQRRSRRGRHHRHGVLRHNPRISVAEAKAVIAAIPPFVTPVGLFVDSPAEEIIEIAGTLNLRHVQLHGHESAELVRKARSVHHQSRACRTRRHWVPPFRMEKQYRKTSPRAPVRHSFGDGKRERSSGTIENDWATIASAQSAGTHSMPALDRCRWAHARQRRQRDPPNPPLGVGLCGGIESSRCGVWAEKMLQFVRAVRADQTT